MVAEITRPRGIRGEVIAYPQSDVPGRMENLKRAHARLADGSDIAVEIEAAWPHKGDWILKFAGVDSMDAAERFRGADLWIPESERGALPDGDFFESDLAGCTLIDKATGRPLGQVERLEYYGGPPLLALTVDGRPALLPFVKSLCQVDLVARTIVIDVPDGLLDL